MEGRRRGTARGTERVLDVARSKGRTEYFEPSNTVGLDTRIWQQRGSANKILGAVFTMAGEIVKVDGCRLLIKWDDDQRVQSEVRRGIGGGAAGGPSGGTQIRHRLAESSKESSVSALQGPSIYSLETTTEETTWTRSDNPFSEQNARNKIFTIGQFTWGETVEIMVAWGDEDTIKIGVVESNSVRLLKTIEIQTMDVRPRFYPRFVDVGQFVIILVGGHAAMKWDGKVLTDLGIKAPPEPIKATFIRGSKEVFFKTSSIGIDDAASVRLRYYQTYINKYGQESELSAPSNEIYMNEYFGLTIGLESADDAVGTIARGGDEADRRSGSGGTSLLSAKRGRSAGGGSGLNDQGGQSRVDAGAATGTTNVGRKVDPGGALKWADRAAMVFLDLGEEPAQEDIVERALYRSINGQLPTALPRRLGPKSKTHFDVRRPSNSSVDPAPAPGDNLPPPMATWAFAFRGRTYYGGISNEPSILYYSGLHSPEAVSSTSFIEVNANDADRLTGWGMAQDYAIVFKKNSAYLVTHDRAEFPVLTPLQATFGAISDRAVVSIDNRTYFMSDVGVHVFDGSKFTRISKILDQMVRNLPDYSRDNAVMWANAADERVYLAVSANPGSENNEVWVIHTDTGAFSRIAGREVTHGISYKGESIVALYNNGSGFPDLYLWGGGHQVDKAAHTGIHGGIWSLVTETIVETDPFTGMSTTSTEITEAGDPVALTIPGTPTWDDSYPPHPIPYLHDFAGIRYDIGGPILGDYETEWMEVGDPNTDKRFYKIALYFVQTGNVDLNVEWCLDWDDRKAAGSTTINLQADDATTWSMQDENGEHQLWDVDSDKKWDKRRVVTKIVDLNEAHGKCIRFRFHTGFRPKEPVAEYDAPYIIGETIATVPFSDGVNLVTMPNVALLAQSGTPMTAAPNDAVRAPDKPKYEPWRLVGWHLFLEDHGVRSRGTDGIRETKV